MHWKSHVLMHARVLPPDAHRIRIIRLVRLNAFLTLQAPLRAVVVQPHRRHQLPLTLISQLPTAHMMTARNDPGSYALSHPRRHNVITNFSFDAHEIAGPNPELRRMRWMDPERVRMRDLIEPLRVRTARVNLYRQTKRRDQDRLTFFEIVFVHMTLKVNGYRELRPAPAIHR